MGHIFGRYCCKGRRCKESSGEPQRTNERNEQASGKRAAISSQKPWRCYKLAQSLGLLLPIIISNYPLTRLSNYSSDNKRSQSGARIAIAVQARYNLLQLPCNVAHIFGRPSYDFAFHLLVFASPDSTGESRNWFCTAPRRSSNLASLQASSRAPGSFLFTTTVLPHDHLQVPLLLTQTRYSRTGGI